MNRRVLQLPEDHKPEEQAQRHNEKAIKQQSPSTDAAAEKHRLTEIRQNQTRLAAGRAGLLAKNERRGGYAQNRGRQQGRKGTWHGAYNISHLCGEGFRTILSSADGMPDLSDTLLQRYLETEDPREADLLLGELVFEHAAPILHRIAIRRLPRAGLQDRDDVIGDVTLSLIAHLTKRKHEAGGNVIRNFEGYAAMAAHNGCDQYLRQRFPERHRLKNRLRYLIGKNPKFALWEDASRGWVCGLELWRERPVLAAPVEMTVPAGSNRKPEALMEDALRSAGAPVPFDAVVDLFARLWSIQDHPYASDLVDDRPAPSQRDADVVLAEVQSMQSMWNEILALPLQQRAALLLNLRDPNGGSALWLIASAAIASVRKIAAALEWPAEDFANIWPRLPLSDLDIAQRLAVTRQQVINLRQAARQRLARRIRSGVTEYKQLGKTAS